MIPFIISRKNYFYQNLIEQRISFLFYNDELDKRELEGFYRK
ncbi:MAG: TDP-N-acetylfucosamine:lipid II N-acetylfucosaminyltransferase [Arsenophonus sp. NC-WZS1-MAG3]